MYLRLLDSGQKSKLTLGAISLMSAPLLIAIIACNLPAAMPPTSIRLPNRPTPTIRPFVAAEGIASDNWAGYVVATNIAEPQNNVVSDVQGRWSVPVVSCTEKETASSIWIGIDGGTDKTVEQAGTEQDCVGGNPVYFAWYELYPKAARQSLIVSVHPGDTISAEIKYVGGDDFRLTLTNESTGENFSVVQTEKRAKRQTAEWIVEAPFSGKTLPLTNFGLVTFQDATVTLKGHSGPISDETWQHSVVVMVKQNETPKAQVSTLTSDGHSFNVLWKGN